MGQLDNVTNVAYSMCGPWPTRFRWNRPYKAVQKRFDSLRVYQIKTYGFWPLRKRSVNINWSKYFIVSLASAFLILIIAKGFNLPIWICSLLGFLNAYIALQVSIVSKVNNEQN